MDRRMFLAFGLIFLILIGSQMLMQKLYPPSEDPSCLLYTSDAADDRT